MIKSMGYLEVLKTNPGASIQDLGRIGHGRWGIPNSGVMDAHSYQWINHLLQNNNTAAIIEIPQPGFKCIFDSDTTIGLAGAKAEIRKNGELTCSTILKICSGDELEIGKFLQGSIVYLAISHGFQTEQILSARSYYASVTSERMLSKGNKIPYLKDQPYPKVVHASVKLSTKWFDSEEIEVYPGPDFNELSKESQNQLLDSKFTISDLANRMAFQLKELLPNSIAERLTAPVYPGTIQLTSGGKIIILMRDAQVTGGYPRILQVSEAAMSLLAQKRAGQQLKFQLKNLI